MSLSVRFPPVLGRRCHVSNSSITPIVYSSVTMVTGTVSITVTVAAPSPPPPVATSSSSPASPRTAPAPPPPASGVAVGGSFCLSVLLSDPSLFFFLFLHAGDPLWSNAFQHHVGSFLVLLFSELCQPFLWETDEEVCLNPVMAGMQGRRDQGQFSTE